MPTIDNWPCWSAYHKNISESGLTADLAVMRIEGCTELIATSETFHDFRMTETNADILWRDAEQALRGRLMAKAFLGSQQS